MPGMAPAGAVDLDAEELAALEEVAKKGYYHARPPNASNTPTPQRIAGADGSPEGVIVGSMGTASAPQAQTTATAAEVLRANTEARAELAVRIVLKAEDLYAVLRAKRSAALSELRLSYVCVAVQVHPNRNCNSDADKAFRRATFAWAELSDARRRQLYDVELDAGRGQVGVSNEWLSMDDSRVAAVLGAAANARASLGSPLNYAATIKCAQELATRAPPLEEQQPQGMLSASAFESNALGVAMSAGLYAAGTAAEAAGYPIIGGWTRRVGLFQGLSRCVNGGMSLLQPVSESKTAEPIATPARKPDTASSEENAAVGIADWLSSNSCLPRMKSSSSGEVTSSARRGAVKPRLEIGARVQIMGIDAAAGLSGRTGEVVDVAEGETYCVLLHPAVVDPRAGRVTKWIDREYLREAQDSPASVKSELWAPASANQFI